MDLRFKWAAQAGMVAVLASGCASEKALHPDTDAPAAFDDGPPGREPAWPGKEWYRDFSSDQLNALIERAASHNWDLAGARARVAQADARARQAGAAILPTVDGSGNVNYLAGHSGSGSGHETDWSALLSASYEIDFWGKNRAAANSAETLATASRAQRDTLALTTLAGIADNYFEILALRERMAIARANVDAARELLSAVQARYGGGSAGPVEVAAQRSALDSAELTIPEFEQQEGEARAALALLIGGVPEGFDVEGAPLESLTEPAIAAGLPADLLRRRPDVFAAEANLQSAHADVAAARAAMFPSVNLTTAAGVQNPALNAAILAIPGTGSTLALTGTVTQAIFDHGRLKAQRAEAQGKEDELLAAYHAAIVAALVDVENSLAALRHLDEAKPLQAESLAQAERAFAGAKLRYQAGAEDYLYLLEAQRTLYAARDLSARYKLARLQVLVGLCKALGGGWTQSA